MAVFIDPKTGERLGNVPEEEAERARSEFGLVTEAEYAAQKRIEKEGPVAAAADQVIAPAVGLNYFARKHGLLDPGSPEEQAIREETAKRFGEDLNAGSSLYPTVTGAANLATMGTLGAVSGGAGSVAAGALGVAPLIGGIAGLATESAVSGVAQEAVDAVSDPTKKEFSAKSALWNGILNMAMGGGGMLLGRLGSRALSLGDDAGRAARGAAEGADAVPGRNWVAELDPGEVPEAIGGARRRARSAGSAGAANAPYRAPKEAGLADDVAEAANDVEPFADDVWEGSQKAWSPGKETATIEDARFLADEGNRKALTDLAAMNSADNLDIARRVLRDDAGLAAKNADIERFAAEWTPEQVAAKQRWVDDVGKEAEGLLSHIDETRRAAADVQAGRASPRVGGAGAVEAGGLDNAIQKTLRQGLDRVRRAEGAEQAIALDGLKRNIGGLVGDIRLSKTIDEATKKERTALLTDFYGSLQKGLETEAYFGRMGGLQKATNEAVTRVIEPMRRVEARISERLDDTFGEVGQKAINRQTIASKMREAISGDPLVQREFLRDLSDGIAAYEDLISARQAHGITAVDDLEIAKRALQEVKNDVQLGRTLGVAEAKAAQYKPGLGEVLKDAAFSTVTGRIPVVGNAAGKVGRDVLERFSKAADLPKTGPLGAALDNRLKAYSRIMDLQDPGVSQRLPDWLQGALRGKGGQVAAVGGVVGAGALLAPGQAGAAELLPEQQKAREGFDQQLSVMPPDQQASAIRTAEAFARIQRRTEQRVSGAVSDLFSLAKNPRATPQHRSPEARQLDRRARELDVPRHLARFMGDHDDPVSAFQDKRKLIQSLSEDPSKLARTMAAHLGDLPTQQPEIFASMVGETMATVEYLAERMPGVAGPSALDPEGYPPTFEEISEWAGHWTGATAPLDTLDDLASNDLVPEQMEAVMARHPDAYAMFQTQAMREIHELSLKKRPIPIEALEQIDSALSLDGAGEPLLSSAMATLLQQAAAAEEQRLQEEAQKLPPPPGPIPSAGPQRLASSSLATLHPQ